jgi:hypothetical protein
LGLHAIAIRRTRVALVPAATFHWLRETSLPFNHYIQVLLNDRLATFTSLAVNSRTGTARRSGREHSLAPVQTEPC